MELRNSKKLRLGYTTGSCAAAATKAALLMLLTGERIDSVSIDTPKGISLTLPVYDITKMTSKVTCAVQKDAGDDADITDGIYIYATVSYHGEMGIVIDGGEGIGRVTKPGLEQPVGAAAINSTPRKMISAVVRELLDETGYEGGIFIVISSPQGVDIAKKTFNPRLGIEGGISILGTSGIVEPMSEQALIETIYLQMRQKLALGQSTLLLSPGNYGQQFMKQTFGIDLDKSVKCSNFIGETFDYALELGISRILLIGHIGKLVKIGAGIMNTHSKMADGRLETLTACALLSGCEAELARRLLVCVTTDEALALLKETSYFEDCMNILLERILYHLCHRTQNKIEIEVILFSNEFGILAKSHQALAFIESIKEETL